MTRRTPYLTLLALVAVLTTGCFGIRADDAEQVDLIGQDIRITTNVCPEDVEEDPVEGREDNCLQNDRQIFQPDADQLLIAYRVPEDTSGPDTIRGSFRTTDGRGSELRRDELTLRRDASYERGLAELVAEDEDFAKYDKRNTKWIGYVSEILPDEAVGELIVTAQLTPAARGAFEHLTVTGYRQGDDSSGAAARARHERLLAERGLTRDEVLEARGIAPELPEDRAVDCRESAPLFPDRGEGGGPTFATTECITDPEVPNTRTTYLRELTIDGDEGFGEAGSTATVPFTLTTTESPVEGPQIRLTATTDLEGATATSQWGPATDLPVGAAPRPVGVQIPAGAAPGTYRVTLTAEVGGESRTASGSVVVVPEPAETAEASIQRQQLLMNADGTVSLRWSCPPLCGDLRAVLLASKRGIAPTATTAQVSKPRLLRIAATRFRGQAGRSGTVRMKLFPKARRAVRRGRTVKAMVLVRGSSGTPVVRRVTISRRR